MKGRRAAICLLMLFALLIAMCAGCAREASETPASDDEGHFSTDSVEESYAGWDDGEYDGMAFDWAGDFSYSDGIDENGFWEGIRALDYVDPFDYYSLRIPRDVHIVPDDTLNETVEGLVGEYGLFTRVMDREVEFGDIVNIDYVGTVDGVEFANGSTEGRGVDVTIGVTQYIDDFLEQLIGYMPGETVNVEVTFPDDYGQDHLDGKDALFVTVINYIEGEHALTDENVAEHLSEGFGWTTVEEMREGVRENIQKNAIQEYLRWHFSSELEIEFVPDSMVEHQIKAMLSYYQEYADMSEMGLDEFVSTYVGVANVDELIMTNYDTNYNEALYYLVIQAIAEDVGITIISEELPEIYGMVEYMQFSSYYGLPYLKMFALGQKVVDFLIEHAVFE